VVNLANTSIALDDLIYCELQLSHPFDYLEYSSLVAFSHHISFCYYAGGHVKPLEWTWETCLSYLLAEGVVYFLCSSYYLWTKKSKLNSYFTYPCDIYTLWTKWNFPLKMVFLFLNKWMPVAKEKWVSFKKNTKSYAQMFSEISLEAICLYV
jgi:hypothetical protein